MTEDSTVQCKDCGFLSVRKKDTREIVEVELGMRTEWRIPLMQGHEKSIPAYESVPICFAHAVSFEDTCQTPEETQETITEDRRCPKFTPWLQGMTPMEHRQMFYTAETFAAQKKWQEEQNKIQRDFQKTMLWISSTTSAFIAILIAAVLSWLGLK